MESVLRSDRALLLIWLAMLSVLSWIYLVVLANDMAAGNMSLMGMGQTEAMTATMSQWSLTTFVLMLVMWCVMMVAMMVPSAAPMILLFATVARKKSNGQHPGRSIAVFITAYLSIWAGFSLLATLAQWALTEAALLSPMMVESSRTLKIVLLLACGTFQLSPLKQACLHKCRSPLWFVMTKWEPGNLGAFKMGVSHGAYCVGCCWLLMALLFLGGVMNLFWVAMIAALVLVEKVLPHGDLMGRLVGITMLALAAYMILLGDGAGIGLQSWM